MNPAIAGFIFCVWRGCESGVLVVSGQACD